VIWRENGVNLETRRIPSLFSNDAGNGGVRRSTSVREVGVMSIRSMRERASTRLLRTGTELAIDQRQIEERLAAAVTPDAAYSSALGAVALARWVDSAILWLGWRMVPRTFEPSALTPGVARP